MTLWMLAFVPYSGPSGNHAVPVDSGAFVPANAESSARAIA